MEEQEKERRERGEGDLPGHEKGEPVSEVSRGQCPLLYTMPRGSPEVATLSNMAYYDPKISDFRNRPFPHGLTQLN